MKAKNTVTVMQEVDGQLVPRELKPAPVRGLPAWARPIPVPKHVKLLVRECVTIPPKHGPVTALHGKTTAGSDRVAVCRGLPKRVRGCEWEVVSVHDRGATKAAEQAVREASPELGVALVLLDSGDRAIKLFDEGGKEI